MCLDLCARNVCNSAATSGVHGQVVVLLKVEPSIFSPFIQSTGDVSCMVRQGIVGNVV